MLWGLRFTPSTYPPKPNQAHTAAAPPAAAVRDTHDTHTAYRRVCLEHHPDKKLVGVECEEAKSKAEEYFKKIQARCIGALSAAECYAHHHNHPCLPGIRHSAASPVALLFMPGGNVDLMLQLF